MEQSSFATLPQEQGEETKKQASFLDPRLIVAQLEISLRDRVADFGAGHGYFTIPLAQKVGPEGKVYGIDIQKEALSVIRAKAQLHHLFHIEYVQGDLEQFGGSKLKDENVDWVVICNLLFQLERKRIALEEAYRILRKGGHIVIIEWDIPEEHMHTAIPFGPPPPTRISSSSLTQMLRETGFTVEEKTELAPGAYHYACQGQKPLSPERA